MHSRHHSLLRFRNACFTPLPIPKEEKNDTTQHAIGIHLYESKAAIFSEQSLVAILDEPYGSADGLMINTEGTPQVGVNNRSLSPICFSISVSICIRASACSVVNIKTIGELKEIALSDHCVQHVILLQMDSSSSSHSLHNISRIFLRWRSTTKRGPDSIYT